MTNVGPVAEIQRYLRYLSRFIPEIPTVYPDGIYGPGTAESVAAFQGAYGLPITGEVDSVTWYKIIDVYNQLQNQNGPPLPVPLNPGTDVLGPGDSGDTVYGIQIMLETLHNRYSGYIPVEITGIYDDATAQAVRRFQERTPLDNTGSVDINTWNAMVRLYQNYRIV